ncbi:MAG: polyribonucleotide nucleotidyltransferase [Candidatus Berkelbacteria bacterium]|nr:polyribonucleotide nucleotidyltransferase [Candidatus Berkelbacteria bacterium]
MDILEETIKFGDKNLTIKTGQLAGQAPGAICASLGETVVLATVVISKESKESAEFFPLLIDYEERLYAAGKISGSRWIKREGRPSDAAILASRLIDRPLRPLFPKGYRNDVQIIVTVLSYDDQHDPDILAIIAASTALLQAGAPFSGPVAAARIGLVDGKFILNPSKEVVGQSKLNLVVAATKEKIMMLEARADQLPNKTILEGIEFAQKALKPALGVQEKFAAEIKKEQEEEDKKIHEDIKKMVGKKLKKAVMEIDKQKREEALSAFEQEVLENLEGDYKQNDIKEAFSKLLEKEVREAILNYDKRPDGRKLDEIREISTDLGLLPRTHGSALFTRGQTQVLSIVTLGAPGDEQSIETMELETKKRFMHHYNFPPFSTGEIKPVRGASRREIGHGALVEKAISPLIPKKEDFPYTIRVVSEVLSSNGSSSMASICASSLALMEAGVPIEKHVAGISIGMVSDKNGKCKLLTDIQGLEDFSGDMDFKVAGTLDGITAIQFDTKIQGIDLATIKDTLEKALKARQIILEKMNKAIPKHKAELSPYAPQIEIFKINPDKIREVIGPGGKNINKIIAETNVEIDIEQDGTVSISSNEDGDLKKAIDLVKNISKEARAGEIYQGRVTRILDFGAFVEIWPGQEGMVHISELAPYRVKAVGDIVKVGEIVPVKVISIDDQGRVNLSLKRAKSDQENQK